MLRRQSIVRNWSSGADHVPGIPFQPHHMSPDRGRGYGLLKGKRSLFQSLYASGERGYTYGDLVLQISAAQHASNWLR